MILFWDELKCGFNKLLENLHSGNFVKERKIGNEKTILSLTSLMLAFILTFIPTTVFGEELTVAPLTYREYYKDQIIQTPVGQNVVVGVFRYNNFSPTQKAAIHTEMVEKYGNIFV